MDWSALRKEARSCESELETYIQSFARIATANENPTEPVDEGRFCRTQVSAVFDEILRRFGLFLQSKVI